MSFHIGMIYGEFKVCTYDACYYCFECHENEEHVIPARVVHNWDLRKHQVAKHCKLFLLHIEEEPLFNIDETNPTLYNVIKELHEVKVQSCDSDSRLNPGLYSHISFVY